MLHGVGILTDGCAATGTCMFVHGGLSNFVLDDLYAVDLSTGAWSEVGHWVSCLYAYTPICEGRLAFPKDRIASLTYNETNKLHCP